MSGRYSTLLLIILTLAMAVGGYFLGAAKAPSAEDALAAHDAASSAARAEARGLHTPQALGQASGKPVGIVSGSTKGRRLGDARGRAAGASSAERQLAARRFPMPAASTTTESEAQDVVGASLPGSGDVLVVGDSLEVLTSTYLKRYLPGTHFTVSAKVGDSSPRIFQLFQESYDPSQSVIVFDAGTNDDPAYPELLASRLQAVAATIGDRCMVVPTIHGPTVNGVGSQGQNRAIRDFAASRPGTQVPNWASAAASHPELMGSDDIHPTAEGADLRAQLIAAGIQACLGAPG